MPQPERDNDNNPDVVRDPKTNRFTYTKGKKWPATVVLVLPFILVLIPMYRSIREDMNWKAMLSVIGVFEVVMFAAEHFALSRGHWVWNESRILGWKVFGVPFEEPFLYYWLGPLLVVIIFLTIKKAVLKRINAR